MSRVTAGLIAAALGATLIATPASAAVRSYRTVDLGTLGGTRSAAFALNDAGQVVGNSETASGETHAFRWSAGRMRDLGTLPGGTYSTARDVNARGEVAGVAADATGETRAVVWRHGRITALAGAPSSATAINDRGDVLGDALGRRVVWHGTTVTDLGPAEPFTSAVDLNDRGEIAGTYNADPDAYPCECRAAVWRSGVRTDLGDLGSTDAWLKAFPTDLNDRGAVAGASPVAGGSDHAFLWRAGTMTDLGTLGGAGSRATALNDRGQVTGFAEVADQVTHPFLWQHGTMTDLTVRGLQPGDEPEDIDEAGRLVLTRAGRALLLR